MIDPTFSVNCYSTSQDIESLPVPPALNKKDRVEVEYKQSLHIPGLMFYLKRQF